MIRAFLVDDEPLALDRLERLLAATGKVAVVGRETDPEAAVTALTRTEVDVLFLDIQMPGLSGFELLARLASPPPVVFTTAYDQHALRAFETSSVDYLLKPIVAEQLDRALGKLERLERRVLERLAAALGTAAPAAPTRAPDRIASRLGSKTRLIEVARITHFFAEDKLTYAVVDGKDHIVDASIAELETRLGDGFFRIHRKTLVNLAFVAELDAGSVRLADAARTELDVARDRVTPLKAALGI